MVGSKEVVLFTQEKNYCIKHKNTLDQIGNKRKLRLYGVITGLSIISQKFAKNATEAEIRNHFARTIDFNEFVVITKDVGSVRIGYAINRDVAFSLYKEYGLIQMTIADVVILNAYWDYVNMDKHTILGYLDVVNGFLVYQIVGRGEIYQFLQRKSIKVDIFGRSSISEEKIKKNAEVELKNIVKLESQRVGGEVDYVIAGLNDEYDRLFHAAINIPKKESLHKFFVNEKAILYKKGFLSLLALGVAADVMLAPQYFSLQKRLKMAENRLTRIQNYISREDSVIKNLYVQKGKTIVLQDRIDLSKLSRILNDINILPPGKVVYKNMPKDIVVDMFYVNHNILAQKYYRILKKNKNIRVELFINPTMTVARIHVVIPKEVLR